MKKMEKPQNLEEVQKFIYEALKNKYGEAVISYAPSKPEDTIVIDTQTNHEGTSDVWIRMCYFH